MSLLQVVAAALVVVGSALVLRAVWLADVGTAPLRDDADSFGVAPAERHDWREAA